MSQNYVRNETLTEANARLVAAQNQIPLVHWWGGGDVASADGLRFVVPVRTVHAGPNPKYFGMGRGVTYYNLVSDQFTGLNAMVIPGTLRDSLFFLALVLEQQTELSPTQIMTGAGAYSDVVFGLFRLLGYQFCPRLADMGGARLRHKLARVVFHGKRGELRQHYREGQEDQLGALGLVVNIIVLWNTIYMDAALQQLRQEGYPVEAEDVARLSPLCFEHINLLGRYAFALPESVARGELRPLRKPGDPGDEEL